MRAGCTCTRCSTGIRRVLQLIVLVCSLTVRGCAQCRCHLSARLRAAETAAGHALQAGLLRRCRSCIGAFSVCKLPTTLLFSLSRQREREADPFGTRCLLFVQTAHNSVPSPHADLDHKNKELRDGLVDWLKWLNRDIGFEGWRFDFVRGYAAKYLCE